MPVSEGIQLTEEQLQVAKQMGDVLLTGAPVQLTVGGYAGTGKTSIIKFVLQTLNGLPRPQNIAVVAFTGKAVSVLRRKGVFQAQTLHSLMYEVQEDPLTKRLSWFRKDRLGEKKAPPITGVIVDEASMLNTSLYDDLLSYRLPVVFVGDHGQLEPIGDNPNVMEAPTVRLEKIHRQAGESPILRLAHAFREGSPVNWQSIPPGCGLTRVPHHQVRELCTKVDVILCGFNRTRVATNQMVRERLGRRQVLEKGERIICLKNNRQRGVFNGMTLTILEVVEKVDVTNTDQKAYQCWKVVAQDDEGRERGLTLYLVSAEEKANEINTKYWPPDEAAEWPENFVVADYGYCVTVHKAQGSEYEKVLVIEEIWQEQWDARKWRYTAATRASKELMWVKG